MRGGLITVTAVAVALLAGCSNTEGGTATPATTTGGTGTTEQSTPTSPSGGGGDAPKVDTPLNATKYLTQPCGVLSSAQLKSFNISKPGTPDTDSEVAKTSGPGCSWSNDDQPIQTGYDASFLTGNKNGLADTYRGKSKFKGYFEPTEVSGYPAVFNDIRDGRPNGSCNITVGISDTLAFRASATVPHEQGAKSCDGAMAVAKAVIQTLKGA